MLRVCVVGSGPGGMYTAKYLLRSALGERLQIDVVDKLPTCYGLVRFGVAPDHPEVKSVTNDFDEVMSHERVKYFGNVEVGADVSVDALLSEYDGVVLSYGASTDKLLGLDKEEAASNVWGARDFVNWYNGHPDMRERAPPLLDCESAAIVGQGNVALDCARVLTKSVDELAKTDISRTALEMLSQSKIKRVSVLGRRGAAQAAFTIKEVRELTKLAGVGCLVRPEDIARGLTQASVEEIQATRAKKRINELLEKTSADHIAAAAQERVVDLRFLVSPTAIDCDAAGRVAGITLQANKLVGEAFNQRAVADPEATPEHLDCGLLIRSIGYKSEPLPGVPFDLDRNTVDHVVGRVAGRAGLYASGWLKRGPSGIIGTNITDAKETVDSIVQDLANSPSPRGSGKSLADLLEAKCRFVDWAGYARINAEECRRGAQSNPPRDRDKILSTEEMLAVAGVPQ